MERLREIPRPAIWDQYARAVDEITRLQGALEFYADKKSWKWVPDDPHANIRQMPVLVDSGEIARAALKPTEEKPDA